MTKERGRELQQYGEEWVDDPCPNTVESSAFEGECLLEALAEVRALMENVEELEKADQELEEAFMLSREKLEKAKERAEAAEARVKELKAVMIKAALNCIACKRVGEAKPIGETRYVSCSYCSPLRKALNDGQGGGGD